jgi:hypothetical protein
MPETDADGFRKMADECREQAERAHSPLDKCDLNHGAHW